MKLPSLTVEITKFANHAIKMVSYRNVFYIIQVHWVKMSCSSNKTVMFCYSKTPLILSSKKAFQKHTHMLFCPTIHLTVLPLETKS